MVKKTAIQMDIFKNDAENLQTKNDGNSNESTKDKKEIKKPSTDTAHILAQKQREISISEFFLKNRHLLGFDNPSKALLTTVKEAVDNSLDACEEAGILPEIIIVIRQISENRFVISVEDNGPGIVKNQVPKIFGKLLYGSKFHTLKQSRGQQGIGISAAGMYAQLTTGKPIQVLSKIKSQNESHLFEIQIDTRKNAPVVIKEETIQWTNNDIPKEHGTKVVMEIEANYKKGSHSVDGYIFQTALANPHATIIYYPPEGEFIKYERVSNSLPVESKPIKPHPYGVELGIFIKMLQDTKAKTLRQFFTTEFSRVSPRIAQEIAEMAGLKVDQRINTLSPSQIELLYRSIPKVKIMAPPSNCLSPIGDELIISALKRQYKADLYYAVTRPPTVYRGNPFLIESGIAYGGELPSEEPVEIMRFANRVPLLYQQSACAMTKAVISTSWRSYNLQQPKGALPIGPMVIFIHIASAWVPFTSESKEAVAHYPEILKEIRLALMECGRQVSMHISRTRRFMDQEKKKSYIEKYIPHIGEALREILELNKGEEEKVNITLKETLEKSRTRIILREAD
ncbi:MAG: DNA topoisomerase VI subunit B [Myxococcota bacterium]